MSDRESAFVLCLVYTCFRATCMLAYQIAQLSIPLLNVLGVYIYIYICSKNEVIYAGRAVTTTEGVVNINLFLVQAGENEQNSFADLHS